MDLGAESKQHFGPATPMSWQTGATRPASKRPHRPMPHWRERLGADLNYPLVAAHRGLSSQAPENTLAALQMGLDSGADLVECDVRLSADGVAVVIHDADLRRTAGSDRLVRSQTVDELKRFDTGIWWGEAFAGQRVPTLEEALRLVRGRGRLIVEIKEPDMGEAVFSAICRSGIDVRDVLLFSFHLEVLEWLTAADPEMLTVWLWEYFAPGLEVWKGIVHRACQANMSAVGLSVDDAAPERFEWAHRHGLPVFVWTANTHDEMHRMIEAGADGICTDYPARLLHVLGRRPRTAALTV